MKRNETLIPNLRNAPSDVKILFHKFLLRAGIFWLLPLLLALPAAVQAQFAFMTNTDNTITITGYTGPGGDVTIPDTINGLLVTRIGTGAFEPCTGLVDITIPNSVTSIGDYAFRGCSTVTNVMIGSGVTNIGSS